MIKQGWQKAHYKTFLKIGTQVARSRAEEQVKALEVTDEFGLHLAELTLQVFTFRIELTLQVFTQLSLPYRVSS